jgi:diadenosine tetraphosphatase ApaH/serine/threonine PP2A family protein phosphatase
MRKYGSLNVWRYIAETFDYMPLSALIDDKIWCVHGGIASDVILLDDVFFGNDSRSEQSIG